MPLSAAASSVLSYARAHAVEGFAEFGDDLVLPDHIVVAACQELKRGGLIKDFAVSDDRVEYVRL
ncbi:MAG: hypothetical protein ACI4PO_01115 [Faecousia sp.]